MKLKFCNKSFTCEKAKKLSIFFVFIIFVISPKNANTEPFLHSNTKLLFSSGSWNVYNTKHESKPTQYFMLSYPFLESGNYKKRGAPYILVRNINRNLDEVSLIVGYTYKTDVTGKFSIFNFSDKTLKIQELKESAKKGKCLTGSNQRYIFDIFQNEQAWVRDALDDIDMVNNMKKGRYAVFSGHSQKGTCSCDIYSLLGFTKSYNEMKKFIETENNS